MVHLGTIVSSVGIVILLHAGYSTAHFQQFRPAGAEDAAPLDATIEAFVGFFVCAIGVLSSAGSLLPIKGAAGGGKSLDAAESMRGFNVFHHRGRSLRKRMESRSSSDNSSR